MREVGTRGKYLVVEEDREEECQKTCERSTTAWRAIAKVSSAWQFARAFDADEDQGTGIENCSERGASRIDCLLRTK